MIFSLLADLSNDESDEGTAIKVHRSKHLSIHQRKQRSTTPENLADDQVFHRNKTPEKRLNHSSCEGSQGSLLEKTRNSTIDRQYNKIPDRTFVSPRSSSTSSLSDAEGGLIEYRRSKERSSGRTAAENRIRRSR